MNTIKYIQGKQHPHLRATSPTKTSKQLNCDFVSERPTSVMTVLRHFLISVENALFIVWFNDASQA